MTRRTLPFALCALVVCPATLSAYRLGHSPEAHLIAGELSGTIDPALPISADGLALWAANGRAWAIPIAVPTHVPVTLYNVNSRDTRTFTLSPTGELEKGQRRELERFFRCKRSGRTHEISTGLLAVLADIGQRYPGHVIEVVSGFRRRGAGARHSKHFTGNAVDFRVRGVSLEEVRDLIWAGHDKIGLGYYRGSDFLHVDHRPREPKIAWNARGEGSGYRYHPSWSKVQ